ncbi:MAG: SAM-dependent methyltransferase [Gammaproteobacteria bacterium]|jgi:SAM-dependent methyltransferase
MKEKIAKLIGQFFLLPLNLIKRRFFLNMAYRRVLEMVVEDNEAYSLGTSLNERSSKPKFYRPADAFEKRFEQVRNAIEEVNAHSLLDIGCAEGYMISRAAKELDVFAIGLEVDRQRIRAGNAQSELDRDLNYGIIPASVDAQYLNKLPKFDVVVCFSVLHHVIRHHGKIEAIEFLKAIRRITRHRFLFDMGSPEETANDPEWGEVLAFMKGDLVAKNKELLEEAGFTDIQYVGDTPGYVQSANRPLFICNPQTIK